VKRTARLALRNRELLLEALAALRPADGGLLLELGSGTGEHAVALARAFPGLAVQPSDPDPEARASIAAWAAEAGWPNLRQPLDLDLLAPAWTRRRADLLLCVNVLHVAPPAAGAALLAGAALVLPPGGRLLVYGPFAREATLAGRLARFDAELRAHDPSLGVRPLPPLLAAAEAAGLRPELVRDGVEPGDVLLVLRRDG
jgi:SAM-dependent methyltransferase